MKFLVTGGAGRLGNVVVKKLINQYSDSQISVLLGPGDENSTSLEGLDINLLQGEITDRPLMKKLTEGVDAVFHLAAKISLVPDKDGSVWKTNVEGTRCIAENSLKNGVKRFIHCSSHHAVHKEPYTSPMDENRPLALDDKTVYHRSKAHGEKIVLELVEKGLPAVIVNPGTVIGPDDYDPSILGKALVDFYNKKIPCLMEGLSDYADVRDIASGILAAYEKGRIGERYFLTGHMTSMKELPELIYQTTGKKLSKIILPINLMYLLLPFIQLYSKIMKEEPLFTSDMLYASQSNPVVSHEKAKNELGYHLRPLEETFKDTFNWYKKQGWINY